MSRPGEGAETPREGTGRPREGAGAVPRRAGVRTWVAGARPRTLPAAVVPVAVGTAIAYSQADVRWLRTALTLLVAVAMQVGVNYFNDYSDGIRGTDDGRTGPLRLVGGGLARPRQVLWAGVGAFVLATAVGLWLAALSSWWLVTPGVVCVLAGWFYTGGRHPYGYRAMGEAVVFLLFGLFAVAATVFIQLGETPLITYGAAVPVGLLASALLVVNNLRDIHTDAVADKRTLAVLLGEKRTRYLYVLCVGLATALGLLLAVARPWTLLLVLAVPFAFVPARRVRAGAAGEELVAVLGQTGRLLSVFGLLFALALAP